VATSKQIVRVEAGTVIDEVQRFALGRCPEAKDGTYLWEVFSNGSSLLSPLAVDARDQKAISIGPEGLFPTRRELEHE
jgi:hypothetical protein